MRNTVKLVFILALIAPYRAGALELGAIKQHSFLNQPLNAQIVVLPNQADDLDQAHIGLAPKSDFEKAGIERRAVLNLIKFKLTKDKSGIPVIKLTSQDPIKEPFLDFILKVTWPKGQLMHEYTVLLDPPAQTPAAGAAGKQTASGQSPPRAQATAVQPPAIATRSIEPKLTRDGYGPTMRPNTLWAIAKLVRPDTSVSIPQVMLAMVKKNPEAFYDNNVNALKAGYVLRIPDKNMINQVSESDAGKEVRQEYHRWLQSKKGASTPAGTMQKKSTPGGGQTKAKPDSTANAAAHAGPSVAEQSAKTTIAPKALGQE